MHQVHANYGSSFNPKYTTVLLLTALQLPNECRGLGDLLGCPLNKNKEMHRNANGVFGVCHLPRKAEDVCEHTFIN